MNQQFNQLSGKGLLAAMVATLLCGQTFADVAGRVTFVAGKVTAIGSDGNTRTLTKGELLNSGERLETGTGRLQIRFTDGSLMSLQPNTVFGLDNYTYSRNKPQDGSLLFNFIRGGIRTVSGAIGRVNRANYAVKTPVGTIGIRGTGYTATQEANGRLLVTVNKGIVNISNEFGNRDIGVGQTFQMQKEKAPEPAEAGVMAEAQATPPQSQQEDSTGAPDTPPQVADEINLGLDILQANNNFEQSNQSNNQGQPDIQVFPFFVQSLDGEPRLSSFASLLQGASDSVVHQNIYAAFDN
ncbi:MAG: FecR domain-containing protein, partial [Moraxellaceae bacterium]|nr:FecR domain-containing protein [Moraxellaceae bacterium]